MLTDKDLVELRKDKEYKKIFSTKFSRTLKSILNNSDDLNPKISIGFLKKILLFVSKNYYIRQELNEASKNLIEKTINENLQWQFTPKSVKEICSSDFTNSIWMRYDVKRVNALFERTKDLFSSPEFRLIVKSHSKIDETEKDNFLSTLLVKLINLQKETTKMIRIKDNYDDFVDIKKEEFYENNEEEIIKKFLDNSNGGFLPPAK